MAVDMFLKADIKGESKDQAHKDEIDVIAYSFGATQSGTAHLGGGAGAGKVSVKDLSITKYIDGASPELMLHCCNGKPLPECTLTVRKAGGDALEYIKLKMTDCIISGVTIGGSGGAERLTENVTINFAKFEYEYVPQKPDGSGDAPKTMGWDIEKNVKV